LDRKPTGFSPKIRRDLVQKLGKMAEN